MLSDKEEVLMRVLVVAVTLGVLAATPLSAQSYGFWGTVYKGPGTEETAGYAKVIVTGEYFGPDTVGCTASGTYGIQGLEENQNYELYAYKYYSGVKWVDWSWQWLGTEYKNVDFHLSLGDPPK